MKIALAVLLALVCFALYPESAYLLSPTDIRAAFVWNLTLALAPALALFFQWRIAKERQLPATIFLTMIAVINTSLVLGARMGAWKAGDWGRILSGSGLPEHPGKTILGGLVLAIFLFAVLRRWWRLSYDVADTLMIGLPLAGALARVGCLYAGCCYGMPAPDGSGICYGPGTPAFTQQAAAGLIPGDAATSLAVYPVQLYLLIGNLLIFIILWEFRKKLARPGAIVFLGFALLATQRFGIEFFRDVVTNRGAFGLMYGGLKMAQWVCLVLAISGLTGLVYVQSGKAAAPARQPKVSIVQLALVLGLMAVGVIGLNRILTLDETMVILISCIPAILVLSRSLVQEYRAGRPVAAPAVMLSATALSLMLSPIDSIGTGKPVITNRQWLEVGASGIFGNYKEISRDCDGNIIKTDIVQYRSGDIDVNSNWQRDDLFIKAGLRGSFGEASTADLSLTQHNYRYSSYGLYGKLSYKWIGLSLGVFNRQRVFDDRHKEIELWPSGMLRIGPASRYSVDFRFFDEPAGAFSNEPVFSMGIANWGFHDPTGNTFARIGIAVVENGESAFHLSGRFPLGNNGLSGDISTYLGGANMVRLGLHYRFGENRRY